MKYLKNLIYGQNKSCGKIIKGYKQQLVLVNKADIYSYAIQSDIVDVIPGTDPLAKHSIYFTLLGNRSGLLIQGNQNSSIITPNWTMKDSEIQRYTHSIQFAAYGIDERTKQFLNQLNTANYFAAVLHNSGIVEIYGWEFGLKANGYTYDGGDGGAIVTLESIADEFISPYVYRSPNGDDIKKFYALFNTDNENRSFNESFNGSFTS